MIILLVIDPKIWHSHGGAYCYSPLSIYVFCLANCATDHLHVYAYDEGEGEGAKDGNNVVLLVYKHVRDIRIMKE